MKKKMRRCLAFLLVFSFVIGGLSLLSTGRAEAETKKKLNVSTSTEMRGVWVACVNFSQWGLTDKSESVYRKNVRNLVKTAKSKGCNTVIFHVRAYDDAIWPSKTFQAASFVTSKSKSGKQISSGEKAYKVYKYDPLEIAIEETHKQNMEFHAWMNPFRITLDYFLDPGLYSSRVRVMKAIDEVLEYDVDAIHFDDYFYHALKGYVKNSARNKPYAATTSADVRCENINKLVKKCYKRCHKEDGVQFGLSPQGNYDNDRPGGADVDTWLSKKGYIDYLVPQIYWSNKYKTSAGTVTLYSNNLKKFLSLRKNNVKIYIGLALYKSGAGDSRDIGWKSSNTVIKREIKLARKYKADGYFLYSVDYLTSAQAGKEVANMVSYLKTGK